MTAVRHGMWAKRIMDFKKKGEYHLSKILQTIISIFYIRFSLNIMKITVLVDNRTSSPALLSEWGLSLHISVGNYHLLFDAGADDAFARNAETLGIDLSKVDAFILSHSHYDHGNGLNALLQSNRSVQGWRAPLPDGICCSKKGTKPARVIDLRADISALVKKFNEADQLTEILPHIFILPATLENATWPTPRGNRSQFLRHTDGTTSPDNFQHELILVIHEGDGLVIFTGCAHSGVCNMIETTRHHFPDLPIKAVIGGFHLTSTEGDEASDESEGEITRIGEYLLAETSGRVWTGHCTSDRACHILQGVMGERIALMESGLVIEL